MLHHQDQPLHSGYGGPGGGPNHKSSASLRNRKGDKDGNFNFLPGKDDEGYTGTGGGGGGGDENRNQVRPRSLGPLGRDPPSSSPSYHHNAQRARMPCWSPLEPLPEVEPGEDGYGRVPPDGAEERRMEEEEGGMMMMSHSEMKQLQRRKGSSGVEGKDEENGLLELEDGDEWGDSDSGSEFSNRSGSSTPPVHLESGGGGGGGEGVLMGGWDRVGVGEPKSNHKEGDRPSNGNREPAARHHGRKALPGSVLAKLREEAAEEEGRSSDSDGGLMDAVWTLRDRERFKAQEMEKHQVQLTMYRRLALIRWVRTLQGHVEEQQERLQSSFDVILTHRKELLRMGAAATVANAAPAAAVGQS